jgi:predicted PurR-regulated permease PerM
MTLSANPEARRRAGQRWRYLGQRLQSVSPQALTRGALGLGVIAVALWLALASWPALAPFVVGAILAYAVLPIANRLDVFLPRWMAALLAELLAVAVLVGIVLLVVPPLIAGTTVVVNGLPDPNQVKIQVAQLQQQLGTIPEPMHSIVVSLLTSVTANLQGVLNGVLDTAAQVVTDQILGIVGTLSTLLGLLVIPAWILTMVADERSIKQRGAKLFAPAIRADVWALFRIVDRVLSTFLRVRLLLAIVAGVFIYVGLFAAHELGIGEFRFGVAAAVLLGSLQLIPELGFFIGFFPLLLALPLGGPESLLTMAVIYWASVKLASLMIETRVSRGVLDVHPGLLIPAIVVLSQFGFLWLLAAAPIVAIARDLIRYSNGRLGDPAAPAGVLPGERGRASASAIARATPSVYRQPTAPRMTGALPASNLSSASASGTASPVVVRPIATPAAASNAGRTTAAAALAVGSSPAGARPMPAAYAGRTAATQRSTQP